jgi:hypothetical protein
MAIGAHVEWLIKQHTGTIGDDMESTFQTVFDKLDNLTRKVDKMALEEVALCEHHMATATPPPAFATTSPETIDFSIGFGFTVLIYVSL